MGTTTLLTFTEFQELPDSTGKRELLDGELIEMPPPKARYTPNPEQHLSRDP
jgi:Uma2 family endonuclease